jgi:hypothetical protein
MQPILAQPFGRLLLTTVGLGFVPSASLRPSNRAPPDLSQRRPPRPMEPATAP